MTIARDIRTGAVVGQVIDETPLATLVRDPLARKRYTLLTRKGYKSVPATSVRLEKVS
jgi:hypothetical protein